MVPALALLWEAREDAQCFGRDVWDFALRLSDLSAVGLPPTDVRWLLVNRLVEHRIESTRSGDAARVFEPSANLALADRSCFVATGLAGAVAAPAVPPVAGRGCGAGDPAGRAVPLWDAASRQLLSGGRVVKRFPRPAPFQELLLAAFEEDGWPDRIDDPLPRTGGRDPDERLHDTVRRLNGHQVNRLIAFVRDGTGEGVCWRPRAARRAPTQRPRSAPGNASPPVRK
jgi:hypothetical protein